MGKSYKDRPDKYKYQINKKKQNKKNKGNRPKEFEPQDNDTDFKDFNQN